ncbi:FimB/Mfa2 family fimbrial subunit [Parabacteroides pacaensis]|uniref:FimB/Mfa2 family fimbrial subunit n=1 Tax=Parabacteroides pacaensis TaxID=2086575 RepID=UPI001F32AD52|nr:FimB/Mfa2 family fimbrial subunit [Parabacteroides pacaensis]
MMKYRIEKQPEGNVRKESPGVGKTSMLLIGLALILMTGCVKDDLYNTPHPDRGAVVVTVDWSGRSSDATVPESYLLCIGEEEQAVTGETNVFKTLFASGQQKLLVCHRTEGITIDGDIATVNTLADGMLEPMPGFLFSAAKELEIAKDDTLRVTAVMQQHIRTLKLTLKLAAGDEERITHTAATLTGILSALDLRSGTAAATEGKTIVPTFSIGTNSGGMRSAGQPVLSASLRLLGTVTGEKQLLTLAITMPDGYVHTLTTDLTEMLKNFGEAEMEPLELDAGLELPTEAGMSATISDWTVVDNGHIDIH